MYNAKGSPTLTACTFSGNSAAQGAGMYNMQGGSPTLFNCKFDGNTASDAGGAMYNADDANPELTDCTFRGNSATLEGGAIYSMWSDPVLTNCTFYSNSARRGGGMYNCYGSSSTMVSGCVFSGNSAGYGGGMYNTYGSDATVTNCVFAANSASGGGIHNDISDATVTNCMFVGNSGGAGAGMRNLFGSNARITNCVFCGNAASAFGGGMDNGGSGTSSPTITNSTFADNAAFVHGGAMYNSSDNNPVVTNCILWSNGGEEIYEFSGAVTSVRYSDIEGGWPGDGNIDAVPLFVGGRSGTWTAAATYDPGTGQTTFYDAGAVPGGDELVGKSLNPDVTQVLQSVILANTISTITVWGDLASIGGIGASYQVNDYRLLSGSPCIDAATNLAVLADTLDLDGDGDTTERTPFDLGGALRFVGDCLTVDTGVSDPPDHMQVVDMGAYEYQPNDIDTDGDVDLVDFASFQFCFTGEQPEDPVLPGCGHFDNDCDDDVDLHDYVRFYEGAITGP